MLNKPFLSIQEMLDKTEKQRKDVEACLDRGYFHPDEASILNGQKGEDYQLIKDTFRTIPLHRLLEYLGRGQTLGDYLVADKVYDDLLFYSGETDKVGVISAVVVNGWEGGDLKVPIAYKETYKVNPSVSGAIQATGTAESKVATLTPTFFSVAPRIGEDLIEDTRANGGLISWHLKQAAKSVGWYATDLAIAVLKTATTGWGTKNGTAGATTDTTIWSEVSTAIKANENDGFNSNTLLTTNEAILHNVIGTYGAVVAAANYWQPNLPHTHLPPTAEGFDMKIHTLDVLLNTSPQLHDSTDTVGSAFTTCVSVIFDRANALLTGRKRWMQIDNYSDPVKDLAGAVITCRQGSVSLQNDAVYVLTEKT